MSSFHLCPYTMLDMDFEHMKGSSLSLFIQAKIFFSSGESTMGKTTTLEKNKSKIPPLSIQSYKASIRFLTS